MPPPASAPARYVLEGRVVTMNPDNKVFTRGRVYVEDATIRGVRTVSAGAPAGFEDARVLQTGGTIYPGLIELHNHLSYNVLPLWRVPKEFQNNGQWKDHREKQQ